jgi:hypothetical protein
MSAVVQDAYSIECFAPFTQQTTTVLAQVLLEAAAFDHVAARSITKLKPS